MFGVYENETIYYYRCKWTFRQHIDPTADRSGLRGTGSDFAGRTGGGSKQCRILPWRCTEPESRLLPLFDGAKAEETIVIHTAGIVDISGRVSRGAL